MSGNGYVAPQTRIINWDPNKPGSIIGEPYTYGPTIDEYRKRMQLDGWGGKPQEYNWLKPKK